MTLSLVSSLGPRSLAPLADNCQKVLYAPSPPCHHPNHP